MVSRGQLWGGRVMKSDKETGGRGPYATPADFKRIFSDDVNSLYLLSLLLTGSPDRAEDCFVGGIGEAIKGNYVFKEWARSWARRTIVLSAIRLVAPLRYTRPDGRNIEVARDLNRVPAILHAEVRAILDLPPMERFAFVLSVLERYSDNECSILLGCGRRDVVTFRTRAMQQLGTFLSSQSAIEFSSENLIVSEKIAMITTPMTAQYFATPGEAGNLSP